MEERVTLGLTSARPVECDFYLYPAQLYNIDGFEEYDDLDTLKRYTHKKLKHLYGREVNLYINGGLLIEILMVILVAEELEMKLHIFHHNRQNGIYCEQELKKRTKKSATNEVVERSLCSGRHFELTADPIFHEIPVEKIMDFEWMQQIANEELEKLSGKKLKVYITGFTPAMISVWNAAQKYFIELEVLHYNKDTENYFAQKLR